MPSSTTRISDRIETLRDRIIEGSSRDDRLNGGRGNDTIFGRDGDDSLFGRGGNDSLFGEDDDDQLFGGDGDDALDGGVNNDVLNGEGGNDSLTGGLSNDIINGGDGDDVAFTDLSFDGADTVDLGAGSDVVIVSASNSPQVRLTFTSSEVGNGSATDSNTQANQDGGLAVRMRPQDSSGDAFMGTSRYDDEGITFVADEGVTFDVRDLVSGAERGDHFEVVTLGTSGNDNLTAIQVDRPYYFNAGMGNDTVTGGTGMDFLVGGAGDDSLDGGAGDDSYIGGSGNDSIVDSGGGNDIANYNVATDVTDSVNLGDGSDVVSVTSAAGTQIRLTFTSSEVGNGSANDSNTMANQDGGLALRFQTEDGTGALTGTVSRFDDEGITFVASEGVTFEVRDLVSGASRGDHFEVVTLGTSGNDTLTAVQADRPYYFNAGGGNDNVSGGNGMDFLVGGSGDDVLASGKGNDTFISGSGNDLVSGASGLDIFIFNSALNATTNVDEITDFSHLDDTIQLDDAVFAGLTTGALAAEAFALSTDAEEADDRIIYNQSTGEVFFDADGGTRDDLTLFATISNKPGDLAADDFLVI